MSLSLLRNIPSSGSKFVIRLQSLCIRRSFVCLPKKKPVHQINLRSNVRTPQLLRDHSILKDISLGQRRASHDGGHHINWIFEKIGSIGLAILLPIVLFFPSKILDVVVAFLIAHHSYVGLELVITDYLRPIVVGSAVAKSGTILNGIITAIALLGLILFSKNQMCFADAAKKIWSIAPKPKEDTDIPKLKEDTPKPKGDTPKPKGDTPTPKGDTPKPKGETPKPKEDTPKPKGDKKE